MPKQAEWELMAESPKAASASRLSAPLSIAVVERMASAVALPALALSARIKSPRETSEIDD